MSGPAALSDDSITTRPEGPEFRIVSLLGEGGMGEVYEAWDEKLERRVALKSIRSDYRLDSDSKTRFLREARVLSQLEHPNICKIFDYIEEGGNDYLVLELIRGRRLTHVLREDLEERLNSRSPRSSPMS